MTALRNAQGDYDPRQRFRIFRLCDCPTCEGRGKAPRVTGRPVHHGEHVKCPDCRGEGRIRQEVAACESPEALGVALVTLAREGEFEECPVGILDQYPECKRCEGQGYQPTRIGNGMWEQEPCPECSGTGRKSTGTWLIRPWLPSARNVSDAGRVLGKESGRKRKASA